MAQPGNILSQTGLPQMYEQWLVGPLFRPFAELLLGEVQLRPGDRVLDVACGTGIVARVAKENLGATGQVAGVDLSPKMLAVARSVAPEMDWREGNATALPLGDGEQFDVVVCHQGLQFFPDKPAAAQQMRRALTPGGRLAVATWRTVEEIPFIRDLNRVAERHLGPIVDQRHSFGDPALLASLLRDAGFQDVRTKTISRTVRFADGAIFVRLNATALAGMSPVSKQMGDEERGRLVTAIAEDSKGVLSAYSDSSGLAFELASNVAAARA